MRRLGLLTAPFFQTDSAKRPRRGGAGLQRGPPLAVPEDLRDPAPVGVRQDHASDREPDAQSGRAEHGAPPGALHPEVPLAPRRAGPRLRRAAGEQHRREVEAPFICAGQQSSGCFCPHIPTLNSYFFFGPPFTKICAKHAVVKRKHPKIQLWQEAGRLNLLLS